MVFSFVETDGGDKRWAAWENTNEKAQDLDALLQKQDWAKTIWDGLPPERGWKKKDGKLRVLEWGIMHARDIAKGCDITMGK